MARRPYKLVARLGPHVRRERFATLADALTALESRVPAVSRRTPQRALLRDYDPVRQVAGRLEIRGPNGARGGIDVRGDGSAEPYRGWVRKEVVEIQDGETAVDALRRTLSS